MAYYEDLTIDQGTDVAVEIYLIDREKSGPKDLTGYSVEAKMKKNYQSDSSDTVVFSSIIVEPPTDGIITLSLTNLQTDLLHTKRRYVYDVEISFQDSDDNTIVERVIEGKINVTPSVTR